MVRHLLGYQSDLTVQGLWFSPQSISWLCTYEVDAMLQQSLTPATPLEARIQKIPWSVKLEWNDSNQATGRTWWRSDYGYLELIELC